MSGSATTALAAVDALLAREPRNLRALLRKADLLDAAGDGRGAAAYYRAVVQLAAQHERLPTELQPDADRAAAMVARYAQAFEDLLRGRVEAEAGGALPARFAQSLDILAGRRQVYAQEPKLYHFPGLAPIQFFDRDAFPWLDAVEAATDAIRAELQAVLGDAGAFAPYLQSDPTRPATAKSAMVDNPDWGAFYLWKNGAPVEANIARCPRTMAALAEVPFSRTPQRSPSILFSLMRPRAHIPPHNGFLNTRLICHLPLIVPPGCAFRVGNETREWVEGRAWVFDDTIEHEAWNPSDRTRVVLLFEVWRPELTAVERRLVNAMFDVIDHQQGGVGAWGI